MSAKRESTSLLGKPPLANAAHSVVVDRNAIHLEVAPCGSFEASALEETSGKLARLNPKLFHPGSLSSFNQGFENSACYSSAGCGGMSIKVIDMSVGL